VGGLALAWNIAGGCARLISSGMRPSSASAYTSTILGR
jgi:hypothetical protein